MNQVYEEDKEETKRKFKTTDRCLQLTFAQLALQFLSDHTFTETDIFFTAGYLVLLHNKTTNIYYVNLKKSI